MASLRALLVDELGYDPYAPTASPNTSPTASDRPSASPSDDIDGIHDNDDSTSLAWRLRRARQTVAEVAALLQIAAVAPARQGDRDVAVVRTASGQLYVLPDRCPHDGGPISDGFVEGEQVVCARHGWEIEACSGACPRAVRAARLADDARGTPA